ncbi:MAG: hypothetical protein NTV86_11890 [Planctomycetota bacterium]|nr:hypothetical protein [Planctomycetota bacterium]
MQEEQGTTENLIDDGAEGPADGWAWPYLAGVAALLAATAWAFRRRAEAAFLGVWFFAILAPSSSLAPLPQQVAAEKRMYLPLAAVVTLVVLGGWAIWQRLARQELTAVPILLAVALAAALGARTVARNADYRTAEAVHWAPDFAEARENLARARAALEPSRPAIGP